MLRQRPPRQRRLQPATRPHSATPRWRSGVGIQRLQADLCCFERACDGHTRTLYTDSRGVKRVETLPSGSSLLQLAMGFGELGIAVT